LIKETKITQNKFDKFDTVEIIYPGVKHKMYQFKGYLLEYLIDDDTIEGFYDSVYIGFYNNHQYTFMGHNIIIQTTRIVLVEKYDFKLLDSAVRFCR